MDELIYNALAGVFDSTLASDVRDFISTIIDALVSIFANESVSTYFKIFTGAAGSLLIIFFLIDLAQNATKDMITIERLVLAFIKLIVGVCILFYLPQLLSGLFAFVKAVYDLAATMKAGDIANDMGITFDFGGGPSTTFPKPFTESMKFTSGNLFKALAGHIGAVIIAAFCLLANWGARLAGFFVAIQNAIALVASAIFSPIAVAQCFDEGQRSVAIQYLKKFVANGLSMAVMIGLLYATSLLQAEVMGTLIGSKVEINLENGLSTLGNTKLMISAIVLNISCIGAIMKSNQLAKDIIGG